MTKDCNVSQKMPSANCALPSSLLRQIASLRKKAQKHQGHQQWIELARMLEKEGRQLSHAAPQTKALLEEACESYKKALKIKPDSNTWNQLGILYLYVNKLQKAEKAFQCSLSIDPAFPHAMANLAIILSQKKKLGRAIELFEQALQSLPNHTPILNNLALLYGISGRALLALELAKRAVNLEPDRIEYYDTLLMNMVYAGGKVSLKKQVWAQYRNMVNEPSPEKYTSHLNEPNSSRKLKVAYLSGDFHQHASSYFTESLFHYHDRENFETYFYYNGDCLDSVTQRYMNQYADQWRNTRGLSTEVLLNLVRHDEIDIIVELSGHTKFNALPALAHKPAPVQVSWLGYPDSTGLHAVDYRITGIEGDPDTPAQHALYTEKLFYLPGPFCCYTPYAAKPELHHNDLYFPRPTPALEQGYITFGSASNLVRLSDGTVKLWSTVMRYVPNSKLLLDALGLEDEFIRKSILARFSKHGITDDRIIFVSRADSPQFLVYHRIDIALDPTPCNAGTTTCDALWMGVPVISLSGQTFASRIGRSILCAAGYPEWAKDSEGEFVNLARTLTENLYRLNEIRLGLRGKILASPLMDGSAFSRNFTNALRQMWATWCHSDAAKAAHELMAQQEALHLCATLLERGDNAQAMTGYKSLIERWPFCGAAWLGYGLSLLFGENDSAMTRQILERAALCLHQENKIQLYLECLAALAQTSIQLGDLDSACKYLEDSLKIENSSETRNWLNQIYQHISI